MEIKYEAVRGLHNHGEVQEEVIAYFADEKLAIEYIYNKWRTDHTPGVSYNKREVDNS